MDVLKKQIMARIHITAIRISLMLITTISSTACVITRIENDIFHKTTWECTEIPLGPLGVETLTMSFDNENVATIVLDTTATETSSGREVPSPVIVHGNYHVNGTTAALIGCSTIVDSWKITFIEVHHNSSEVSFLLWQAEDILYPFTTTLHLRK